MTEQRKSRGVVYPRFLGVDGSGDFVWELADGRWTWGDDPMSAATRQRTFPPDRYIEKYEKPEVKEPFRSRAIEAEPVFPGAADPDQYGPGPTVLNPDGWPESAEESMADIMAARKNGGHKALARMLSMLDGWIEGAYDNHVGLGHRGEDSGMECWRSFAPSDIRNMINDVARELGLDEFPAPAKPQEDEVR